MTEIYLHLFARITEYMETHPNVVITAPTLDRITEILVLVDPAGSVRLCWLSLFLTGWLAGTGTCRLNMDNRHDLGNTGLGGPMPAGYIMVALLPPATTTLTPPVAGAPPNRTAIPGYEAERCASICMAFPARPLTGVSNLSISWSN